MTVPALRDYQEAAVQAVRRKIAEGHRRVLLQGATGSGKTNVSCAVCVGAYQKGRRALFIAHRRRLIAQKSDRLKQFGLPHGIIMAGESGWRQQLVQVASRDTLLSRSVRNEWVALPEADLVIVDEAHTVTAPQYQRLLEAYQGKVVLGLTATPSDDAGAYFTAMVCTVPTSRLVADGWLVPVKCYSPAKGGRGGLTGDPVDNWLRYAKGRPTILFTSKVKESRAAVERFRERGVAAEHIDAHTPDEERQAVDDRLRSGKTLVVGNVGVWTEGCDIPQLSCCVLLRATGSYILYAQAVGRVMRSFPGKADAVLLDHAGAVHRYGFPDEDVAWKLDPQSTIDDRVKKAKKDGAMKAVLVCPACGFSFSGQLSCPECGRVLPARAVPPKVRREMLVAARRKMTPEQLRGEQSAYWSRCLYVMAARGQTMGAAASMYRARYGAFPDGLPDCPPPGPAWRQAVAVALPHVAGRFRAAQ